MRRGTVAYTALALIGLGLAGCGLYTFEKRAAGRDEAEAACLSQKLVQPTAYMSRMSAIDGPGACGMNHPFKVAAFAGGSVGLASNVTLACPIIPTIDAWFAEVVQPAASLYFGTSVAEVKSGSYSCRPRNSQSGAKLSEHAFGNAFDVMAFRLADGREISVVAGWRVRFLRCRFETTRLLLVPALLTLQLSDASGQGRAVDELHGVVVDAVLAADEMYRHDVAVMQAGRRLRLVLKPAQALLIEHPGQRQ